MKNPKTPRAAPSKASSITLIGGEGERTIYTGPTRIFNPELEFADDAKRRIKDYVSAEFVIEPIRAEAWWRTVFGTCKQLGMSAFVPWPNPSKADYETAIAAARRLSAALKPLLDAQDIGLGNVDQMTLEQVAVFIDWATRMLKGGIGPSNRRPNINGVLFLDRMSKLYSEGFGRAAAKSKETPFFRFVERCMIECGVESSLVSHDRLLSIIRADQARQARAGGVSKAPQNR